MEKALLDIFLMEIRKEANRAIFYYKQANHYLQKGCQEDFFRELEHFIFHVATISFILWNGTSALPPTSSITVEQGFIFE